MPFKIVRNDITKMHVDAIVNTANEAPQYSSGVDTAVYHAAGEEELLAARKKIGWLKEGDVVITPGFKLPAKYIIHAVSPCYIDGSYGEEELLRGCYRKSLQLAYENKCESMAFPLISTGCFGYPKEEGMCIALDEINTFLMKHNMMVYLVVFDTAATKLGLSLYPDLEAYIDHHYVCEKREEEYGDRYFGSVEKGKPGYDVYKREREYVERNVKSIKVVHDECYAPKESICMSQRSSFNYQEMDNDSYDKYVEDKESALKKRMAHISDTFQQYLLYLIDEKGLKASEVYNKGFVTKQLFSKIKLNENYHPDKATAMKLCVGAQLNIDETKDLLGRAGYALSPCDKRDIIFSFFIENQIYDMVEIDLALEDHGLPCFIE